MTTLLRQVLNVFDNASGPLTLSQVARELGVEKGVLEEMIRYWVRKGELREVSTQSRLCASCGSASGCPLIIGLPHYYERVSGDEPPLPPEPPCRCGGGAALPGRQHACSENAKSIDNKRRVVIQ